MTDSTCIPTTVTLTNHIGGITFAGLCCAGLKSPAMRKEPPSIAACISVTCSPSKGMWPHNITYRHTPLQWKQTNGYHETSLDREAMYQYSKKMLFRSKSAWHHTRTDSRCRPPSRMACIQPAQAQSMPATHTWFPETACCSSVGCSAQSLEGKIQLIT